MNYEIYQQLGIALGLGLLVGMQREWSKTHTTGVRTFALITLLGAMTAVIEPVGTYWLSAAGLLAVVLLLILVNAARMCDGQYQLGITTEAAVLLMYSVGIATGSGYEGPAVVVGGLTALLLHWKDPIHGFIRGIGESDFKAIARLVLIALVILPLLPNEEFGPYEVLNPFRIWLMVVLIVGISLSAYVIQRALGSRVGSILGGLLGGMISSTATTVSYARQAANKRGLVATSALVIVLASAMANVRVMVEIAIVAPKLLMTAGVPLAILTVWTGLLAAMFFRWSKDIGTEMAMPKNPAQLKTAVVFGLLYALVLLLVAAGKDRFGDQAIYAVAALSGLTDLSAITLSAANLFRTGQVDGSIAWRAVLIAIMSNLVFKTGAVALLGARKLFVMTLILHGLAFLGAGALLMFWPY